MFDPGLGRFIQPDPMGFAAGDPDIYRYEGNDPANSTDPSGLGPVPGWRPEKWYYDPDGRWPADRYWTNYVQGSTIGSDFTEFRRGCIGLCNVRLGLPYQDVPLRSALKCFKNIEDAESFRASLQQADRTSAYRIFAVLFDKMNIPEEKWNDLTETEQPLPIVDLGQGFDFCTFHKPAGRPAFWESMECSFAQAERYFEEEQANGKRYPEIRCSFPSVIHRNVETFHERRGRYNYVLYCVVKAKSNYLPPLDPGEKPPPKTAK
jgi:hypothetical protein